MHNYKQLHINYPRAGGKQKDQTARKKIEEKVTAWKENCLIGHYLREILRHGRCMHKLVGRAFQYLTTMRKYVKDHCSSKSWPGLQHHFICKILRICPKTKGLWILGTMEIINQKFSNFLPNKKVWANNQLDVKTNLKLIEGENTL